jgi:WD40 repeat protein
MSEPLPLVDVLLRQREAWQAGRRPRVEDLLREFPHLAEDDNALLDLIYNETVLREEKGESSTLDEYLQRFPRLESDLRVQFEVDQAISTDALASPRSSRHGSTAPFLDDGPTETTLPRLEGCDLIGELGRGAMGVVYRGWQHGAKRVVAVKLLSADVPLGRIGNEVEAASRLLHPHIVQVFEVKELQGCTALVLEYVEGGNLAQKLAGKPQPPAEAARLVETLAWAMAYAHGRGVIHRDLKPSNVLLSGGVHAPLSGCIPKIGDFGLAKLVEGDYLGSPDVRNRASLTRTSDVIGTPSYMAPEQTGGAAGDIGPTADVYALGALLYECLTGRPPFLGQSVLDTLEQVRNQEPVPPSRLQPKIPRDLEIICLKCLHKSPARRYQSARELAEDLKRFQANEPIKARPVSLAERVWKWARRRPAAAALVVVSVVAILLLAAGGVTFSQVWRKQRDDALVHAKELDAQLQRTRQLLYTAQLLRVGSVWESDPIQGLRMLEDPSTCPPDLRCFSWGVLRAQCKRYRLSLNDLAGPATAVAWSPDGKLLATGTADGQIKLWNPASGAELAVFSEHIARVSGLAFSGDGELLASSGYDGKIHLWDVPRRKLRGSLTPGGRVAGIAFHPDRRIVAANSGPPTGTATVTLWDTRALRLRRKLLGPTSPLSGVAISPDGNTVVCAAPNHALRLWDSRTGRAAPPLLGHPAPVTCLAFAPSGRALASGSLDGKIGLWDLVRGGEVDLIEGRIGPVTALAFHRGEQTLAVAGATIEGDSEFVADVQFIDTLARRGAEPFRAHPGGTASLAFSADGKTLATAGADRTVKLWDHPGPLEEVVLRGHTGVPRSVSLSRDGKTLAWISRSQPGAPGMQLSVYDLVRGTFLSVLRGHGRPVRCLALSPNGALLASAAGADDEPAELLIWEVASGRLMQAMSGHAAGVTAVAFSPDGKDLASAARDGAVKVWDVQSGKARLHLVASTKPVLAVAFSGDGRTLVAGGGMTGQPGTIDVWDASSGKIHSPALTSDGIATLAITNDGSRVACAGQGGQVELVTLASPGGRTTLSTGMKGIACVAFSPDGQTLAIAGTSAGVKLWDVPTEQERASLPRHRGGACFVSFASDGRLLVSASTTQTARLWHSAR